jgi:hypothetical protein
VRRQIEELDAECRDYYLAALVGLAFASDRRRFSRKTRTQYAIEADLAAGQLLEAAATCGGLCASRFAPPPAPPPGRGSRFFTDRADAAFERFRHHLRRVIRCGRPFKRWPRRLTEDERLHLLADEAPQALVELRAAALALGLEADYARRRGS